MAVVSVTVGWLIRCGSPGCSFFEVPVSRGRVIIENAAHTCQAPRGIGADGRRWHLWNTELGEQPTISIEVDRVLPDVRLERAADGSLFVADPAISDGHGYLEPFAELI